MVWPEISQALSAQKRELILSGEELGTRIKENGVDERLFTISSLNYLNINSTNNFKHIPDNIVQLQNLQSLVLHGNSLTDVNPKIFDLHKLKLLDLSHNSIEILPNLFAQLPELMTLNISRNKLETLPDLSQNGKLAMLDAAENKIANADSIFNDNLKCLSEVVLTQNCISSISSGIGALSSLKRLEIGRNQLKSVPHELCNCSKIKILDLKENPFDDKRLGKTVDSGRLKQILGYIKDHVAPSKEEIAPAKKKNAKKGNSKRDDSGEPEGVVKRNATEITVRYFKDDDGVTVDCDEEVKSVRPYVLCCLIRDVKLTEENFKKFIRLQTEIHDGACGQRNLATIATHDFDKLAGKKLLYTAEPSDKLKITPLNYKAPLTGQEFYDRLQEVAECDRKDRKRNQFSGIYKYLYLLKDKKNFPCLKADNDVISLPPISNSDITKITGNTCNMLLEVTSDKSLTTCSSILDHTLLEFAKMFDGKLVVEQVKITHTDGQLKSIYPSRVDLQYRETQNVNVERLA